MRVPLASGSRLPLVTVPDDAVLLVPPPPLDPLVDVGAAVVEALRYPLAGPPLHVVAPRDGRATVVVQPHVASRALGGRGPAARRAGRRARCACRGGNLPRPADGARRRWARPPGEPSRAGRADAARSRASLPGAGRRPRLRGGGSRATGAGRPPTPHPPGAPGGGRRRHRRCRRDRSERRSDGARRRVRALDDSRGDGDVAARAVGRPGLAARRSARSRAAAPGSGRRALARPRPAAPHRAVSRLPVGSGSPRGGHALSAAARRQRRAGGPATVARRAAHVRAAHGGGARGPAVGRARGSAAPWLGRPRRPARAPARHDRRAAPPHRARNAARAAQPDHGGRARARACASPVAGPAAARRRRHRSSCSTRSPA